jgi:hypothetical protein
MTTTNAVYYGEQYDQVSAGESALNAAYSQSLDSLSTENSSDAMVTIMTSTLILVCMWQEAQMMNSIVTMDALSSMETDENGMQSDFDDYNQDWNDTYNSDIDSGMDSTDASADADSQNAYLITDAESYAYDMESIAALPEFSSISGDVDTQVDTIFDTNSDGSFDTSSTQSDWDSAVNGNYSSGSSDDDQSADLMQGYTNAFSALSTDFSNQSSEAQSEMQYYESEDQQMQGLDETLMQDWATELQSMVNNQITS